MSSELSYASLNGSLPIFKGDALAVTFPESKYIGLFQRPLPGSQAELRNRVGWVFYVSLKDEASENVAKGWDVLKDLFLEFHVTFVLVTKQGHRLESDLDRGKQISIYHFLSSKNPPIDLKTFLTSIEGKLTDADVLPGDQATNTKPVSGSRFITYHDNEATVVEQRKILAEQDPELDRNEFFMSPYIRTCEMDIPRNVDFQQALDLVQAHQIFYEIDRRLPMRFSFTTKEDQEGKHILFDGSVMLAMKVGVHALKTLLPVAEESVTK